MEGGSGPPVAAPAVTLMGRPTKFTPESQERFLQALRAGAFPQTAARFAGFSPASMYRYLKGTTPEHDEFRSRVDEALASLEIRLTGTLAQAAFSDPRWALAMLERRFPERWRSRTPSLDHEEEGEARASGLSQVVLDPDLADEMVRRLLGGEGVRVVDGTAIDRFETTLPAGRVEEEQ